MRFQIVALHPRQGISTLSLEAASFDEARILIRERGLDVVSIRQAWHWTVQRQRHEPKFELLRFSQELRSLVDAGLSLVEALTTLARKERSASRRRLIEVLIRQLREGKPFSLALREFPEIFPPLYIALITASEQTGELGNCLGRFNAYRSQMDQARKRVVAALIYPALLLGVGGLVIAFLMGYVVPRFSRIYEEFGRELPWLSRLLLEWGQLVDRHGLDILIVLLALGGLVSLGFRHHPDRSGILRKVLAWPLLRDIRSRLRLQALSRFFRTLGLLQQAGIPIISALGLGRELLDEEARLAVDHLILDLRAGQSLSTAMEARQLAPPVAAELLKVGEKTGDVGEKMIRIAEFYDEEIARWSEWFLKLFEPLLMLTIGLFIAVIVVLLYLPIFDLAGSLG